METVHVNLCCFIVVICFTVNCDDSKSIWETSGLVPLKVSRIPDESLFVFNLHGDYINTNDEVVHDDVVSLPNLFWETNNTADLFTVILMDVDIPSSLCGSQISLPSAALKEGLNKSSSISIPDCRYIHYLVVNVPGESHLDNVTGLQYQNVSKGDIVLAYQPPAPFELDDDDTFREDIDPKNHRYVWLVYKQQGHVSLSIPTPDCGAGSFSTRVMSSTELTFLLSSNKILFSSNSYSIPSLVASYSIRFPVNGFNISLNNITTNVANYTIVTNVPAYSIVTPVVDLSMVAPVAGTFWRVNRSTNLSLQATCCLLDCEIEGLTDLAIEGFPLPEPPAILGNLEDACFNMFGLFTCS